MEVAAIALQQANAQTNLGLSLMKKSAQADQALINVLDQTVQSSGGGRGQNLDITV